MTAKMNFTSAAIALAMTVGAGCRSATKPSPPAPAPVAWKAPVTRADSTAELAPLADEFDQQVGQLPGDNGTDHRRLTLSMLDNLIRILELANGPDQSPAFANRIGVIKSSRDSLNDQTIPRPRMEASENQILVAAVDALDEVSTRFLFDDDKLPDLVKTAREKVSAALKSQGPIHDIDASAGFGAVRALVRAEADGFIERFGTFEQRTALAQRTGGALPIAPEPAPMTPPALPPATMPGPAPATMPAAVPMTPATAPTSAPTTPQ